jgi:1-acyl-sn-glycerol-3-phosphate acyltransferase
MEATEIRQRKPAENMTELLKLSTKPPTEPHLKHGVPMQLLRSFLLGTWMNCCVMVICVTQLIGCPLYVINRRYYYSYMAYTKQCFALVLTAFTQWSSPTLQRVSGDASVRGQIHISKGGLLETRFPERLVMISNHQVYTDWIYLWWVAYTNEMHGRIFIILKESLKYIPVLGTGMMFYGFIFMARKWLADKPRLQHRLEKLKTNYTGSNSARPTYDPMWLLIFPEGTNLSINTKGRSDAWSLKQGLPSFKHVILPRSTGLFFCLQQLRGTVDWVYDCTIAYEGPPYVLYLFPL